MPEKAKASRAGQQINVVMKKYDIQPNVIHVKRGELVELDVTTSDVQHGLDVLTWVLRSQFKLDAPHG